MQKFDLKCWSNNSTKLERLERNLGVIEIESDMGERAKMDGGELMREKVNPDREDITGEICERNMK